MTAPVARSWARATARALSTPKEGLWARASTASTPPHFQLHQSDLHAPSDSDLAEDASASHVRLLAGRATKALFVCVDSLERVHRRDSVQNAIRVLQLFELSARDFRLAEVDADKVGEDAVSSKLSRETINELRNGIIVGLLARASDIVIRRCLRSNVVALNLGRKSRVRVDI